MENAIWPWFDGQYKVHCNNYEAFRRISGWKDCIPHGVYSMPDGSIEWDVIIPEQHVQKARQVLGLDAQSQTPRLPRKPTKGRNDLCDLKSPLSPSNRR